MPYFSFLLPAEINRGCRDTNADDHLADASAVRFGLLGAIGLAFKVTRTIRPTESKRRIDNKAADEISKFRLVDGKTVIQNRQIDRGSRAHSSGVSSGFTDFGRRFAGFQGAVQRPEVAETGAYYLLLEPDRPQQWAISACDRPIPDVLPRRLRAIVVSDDQTARLWRSELSKSTNDQHNR